MNQKSLSICIPTFNRELALEGLLNNIIPQALEFRNEVEICISNNGSMDNTRQVVMKFKEKYYDLIKYNENEKNLGFDRNLLKVINMAEGKLVWIFGDDDSLTKDGLGKVTRFIKEYWRENVGLIVLARESYITDKQTENRKIYYTSLYKNKPRIIKLNREEIIGARFNDSAFMSVLVFNNKLLKKVLREDRKVIYQGFEVSYIHMLLYRLMFLKNFYIDGYVLNEPIILQEMPYYKFIVEDELELLNRLNKIENLLLSTKYADAYANLFISRKRNLKIAFIFRMMYMKTFENFNYLSYFGCIRLFFHHLLFRHALLFSIFFLTLSITPSIILRNVFKALLKVRYGREWKSTWFRTSTIYSKMSKGKRSRLTGKEIYEK